MRWFLLLCLVACGSEKKPKQHVYEDAAVTIDAPPHVGGDADRDKLFLSVPSSKAVARVIETLSAKPHFAGTPENEEVAKEIMRTLGRMGWQLGTQQYDVYLPHPKKASILLTGDKPLEIDVKEKASSFPFDPFQLGWIEYSASGKVAGPLVEDMRRAKGAVVLMPYGPLYRGAQVAAAERAGAKAVIFYDDDAERETLQRGTAMYYWQYPGDPLTPGVAARADAARKKPSEVEVLPKILVLAVTSQEATKMRAQIGRNGMGPIANVEVELDHETRPVRDIIAILPGKSQQAVILGNHYDAWGPGALDPHSGTATMIEIARGLTALVQGGWRPRRTIVLAFWDAEEPGMIGSTEWVEEQGDQLAKNAVAYFNVDTIKAGSLVVQASPALRDHVASCAADVIDPNTSKPFSPTFKDVGIGSDFTAFLHHAGIASLQWQTGDGPGKYHVWHSMLDDVEHVKTQSDPDFKLIPAFAQVMGLCAIRLADAEYLPMKYTAMADWIDKALPAGIDRSKLDPALAKLRTVAMAAESMPRKAGGKPDACNAALAVAERGFLAPDGLASRPWYRHLAIGPDPSNGYAPLPLPELADPKAKDANARLVAAIERVAAALEPCR